MLACLNVPKTVLTAPKRHFRCAPINGHHSTGPVGPVRAKSCPDRLEMRLLLCPREQTQLGHPGRGIATAILTMRRPDPPPDR
jgi:hypothetical protein